MIDVRESQYYYRPHRSHWGVFRAGEASVNGVRFDTFVRDFDTKEEAIDFVYKMNKWK